MLLDRQRVDRAEGVQLLAQYRSFRAQSLVVQLQNLCSSEQLVDGLLPLRFESLTNRRSPSRQLGVAELRRVQLLAKYSDVVPHFREHVLVARQTFVHFTDRQLGVGKLLFGVLECRLSRVEITLPLRQLLSELRVRARQRGELQLQ